MRDHVQGGSSEDESNRDDTNEGVVIDQRVASRRPRALLASPEPDHGDNSPTAAQTASAGGTDRT